MTSHQLTMLVLTSSFNNYFTTGFSGSMTRQDSVPGATANLSFSLVYSHAFYSFISVSACEESHFPPSTFSPFSSMKVLITPFLFCFLPSFWPTASLPLSPSHHCFQLFLLCSPSSLYPVLILKDLNIQIRLIAKLFNPTPPCFIDESLTSEWNASIVHLQEVYLKTWLIDFSVKCYIWSFFKKKKSKNILKLLWKRDECHWERAMAHLHNTYLQTEDPCHLCLKDFRKQMLRFWNLGQLLPSSYWSE